MIGQTLLRIPAVSILEGFNVSQLSSYLHVQNTGLHTSIGQCTSAVKNTRLQPGICHKWKDTLVDLSGGAALRGNTVQKCRYLICWVSHGPDTSLCSFLKCLFLFEELCLHSSYLVLMLEPVLLQLLLQAMNLLLLVLLEYLTVSQQTPRMNEERPRAAKNGASYLLNLLTLYGSKSFNSFWILDNSFSFSSRVALSPGGKPKLMLINIKLWCHLY